MASRGRFAFHVLPSSSDRYRVSRWRPRGTSFTARIQWPLLSPSAATLDPEFAMSIGSSVQVMPPSPDSTRRTTGESRMNATRLPSFFRTTEGWIPRWARGRLNSHVRPASSVKANMEQSKVSEYRPSIMRYLDAHML